VGLGSVEITLAMRMPPRIQAPSGFTIAERRINTLLPPLPCMSPPPPLHAKRRLLARLAACATHGAAIAPAAGAVASPH